MLVTAVAMLRLRSDGSPRLWTVVLLQRIGVVIFGVQLLVSVHLRSDSNFAPPEGRLERPT